MPRSVFDLFLSSTSDDLKPYRAKVSEMVERMRQTTIRMETFGAKPSKPLKTCQSEVEKCDALIVIVGHRYGWVPSEAEGGDGKRSITWWEVWWALQAKKPVYAFLVDPQAPWQGTREQDRLEKAGSDEEILAIGKAVRSLAEFRSFLESETTREAFTSAEDLGGKVATSLNGWLVERAIEATRAEYLDKGTAPRMLPTSPSAPRSADPVSAVDSLRWREQLHLLSAQQLAHDAEGIRIALIAGRPDATHQALAGAKLQYLDVRFEGAATPPDDYTTAMAALLVGAHDGYVGVAPGAALSVLQCLDHKQNSTTVDVLTALDAAAREGAKVVCLPLGGLEPSELDAEVHRTLTDLGLIIVCPAGNEGSDKPVYPAAYPSSFSATAVDRHGKLADFASHGKWVTVAAPGVDIPVAVGDGYRRWSGSSFACAMLAGTIALMLKQNPKLEAARIRDILRSVGPEVAPGLRLLDASDAVQRAIDTQTNAPRKPVRRAAAPPRASAGKLHRPMKKS